MKQIRKIAFLLLLFVLVLIFAGCDSSSNTSDSEEGNNSLAIDTNPGNANISGNGAENDSDSTDTGEGGGSGSQISVEIDMVSVPGGTVVGTKNIDNVAGVFIEGRTVILSDFWMAKYPVTKAQYKAIMSDTSLNTQGITADPSYCTIASTIYVIAAGENDDNRPVEGVTWYDAVYFCNLLSKSEGLEEVYTISGITTQTRGSVKYISSATVTMNMTKNGYRLPTEAEWEYAARGGNPDDKTNWNYLFSGAPKANGVKFNADKNSGLDKVGWYCYNLIKMEQR